MTVLDTDIFSLYSLGDERIRRKMEQEGGEFAVTLITRMEVLRGRFAYLLNASDREDLQRAAELFAFSERVLSDFTLLRPNPETGVRFDALRVHKKARKMRRPDMLIACITLAHDALLITRNAKDFKDVPGLRMENWADD